MASLLHNLEVLGSCMQFTMIIFFWNPFWVRATYLHFWHYLEQCLEYPYSSQPSSFSSFSRSSRRCYAWNISSRSIWRRITRKSQACSHAISSATFYLTLLATRKESRYMHCTAMRKCRWRYKNRAKHSGSNCQEKTLIMAKLYFKIMDWRWHL